MKDPFIKKLIQLAETNPKLTLIVGDLGFGMIEPFIEKFPKQFLNVGVAEQNMAGVATGMALEGHTVFTYSIANFATLRCLEQIRNDASYHGANVNVVAMGGGFSYGALGFSHHATEDLAILRALPGVAVVSPSDDWEAGEATEALAKNPGVGYLRLDKSVSGYVGPAGEKFHLGKARVLREGKTLSILATGGIVRCALQAAERLKQEKNYDCRVISLHTIKPLDMESVLKAATETGGLITLEEHSIVGGLGSAVAECLMDAGVYPKRFRRIALNAGFTTIVGSQDYLRTVYGIDTNAVASAAIELIGR